MTSRDNEHRATHRALFSSSPPALLAEARRRQDEIVAERFGGQRLRIADLGCGDGYHASLLAPQCAFYHAYELAPQMAAMARQRFASEGLDRATLFEVDVSNCDLGQRRYDLVLCMYFTPGNFRDVSDDLSLYSDQYLDHNPVFTRIVRRFYQRLDAPGQMLLTVYRDTPQAEQAQLSLYRSSGQQPVTPPGSRFVATAEGFWSVRWTRHSMLSNLADAGIGPQSVQFHELNEIAWLVQIDTASEV